MTFSEVRQYQYGDDVRSIDWNVTARYNEPFVKVFEEERELTMMLMVDVSGSEFFGTVDRFKRVILTEISATLAFSALQNNDKVGLILFSGEVELFIPPKKGKSHVLRIIRELLEFEPKSHLTDISGALKFLSNVLKKKSIVFVLSDFMAADYEHNLRITGKKHDLTGIRVFDPMEQQLPDIGVVSMKDAETGQIRWVNTHSRKIRETYSRYYGEQVDYFRETFARAGCGQLDCRVDESYVKKLLGYFKQRA